MEVGLVHDYLTQRGGAERVVLSMLKAFPNAALHTSLYEKDSTFPEFSSTPVRTMALDRVGVLRRNHRLAFPLLAPAFSHLVVDCDVALCSSSGWAHGARVTGRKIVYCYSPARWLYQGNTYLGPHERAARMTLAVACLPLLRWDRRMAATATRYLTLSNVVKERIFEAYGIVAEVLPPPPSLDPRGPSTARPGLAPGFFLCVSRLLPYKNVDAIVEAFATMPDEQLVVVGEGPEAARLGRTATSNVKFLGLVDDSTLRWLYNACAALIAASFEDYGLTPLEAASFGKPAAALRAGGYLETVVEEETGVFFDAPVPSLIVRALRQLARWSWSGDSIRAHAASFDEARFVRRLREVVAEEGSKF